jgi:NitT/TauT family transport system substrate-binding protein
MQKIILTALLAGAASLSYAEDVVRLGNLKFAHYGAVSYMKEICPKYGIKVDERMFAKGPDIMPAIVAGEIDIAALASDGAISGRANGVQIVTVAGFAKGKRVGVTRGGAHELLIYAELEKAGLTWSDKPNAPGKDVQIIFLAFADLNQALLGKQIDAMCQSEPQSSQAINKKFGIEIMKPYSTAMGEPYRLLVMSEKMYTEKKDVAQRLMKCFVESTALFNKDPLLAEKYVREQLFKGQLTSQDFRDAMDNAAYTYDVSPEHIDVTIEFMNKYGVGRMSKPPKSAEWVRLDLLQNAKAELKIN